MKLGAGIALALAALAASAVPAPRPPDEPDLVIRLPACAVQRSVVAPVFVDAYEEPGHLLYRFDAVIANQGGTLDLFRTPAGVGQAVWPGRRRRRTTAEPGDDPVGRVRRPLRLRLGLQLRLREDARALPLLLGRALLAAAGGRGGAGLRQGRLLPVRLLRAEAGQPLRLRRARAGRRDVVRVQRPGPGVRPDGALAGRRRHLQRPARAPVGRHHGPGAGARGRARPGQPAAVRAREQRGEQHHERVAGDPGRAGGGRSRRLGGALVLRSGQVVAPGVPARRSGGCQPGRTPGAATSGPRRRGRCASASCASRRTASSRWRRAPTGCTRRPPTRRRRASRARTPSPTWRPTRAG